MVEFVDGTDTEGGFAHLSRVEYKAVLTIEEVCEEFDIGLTRDVAGGIEVAVSPVTKKEEEVGREVSLIAR